MVMLPIQNAPARQKTVPVVWRESAWAFRVIIRSGVSKPGDFAFRTCQFVEEFEFMCRPARPFRNHSGQIKYIRFVQEMAPAKRYARRRHGCGTAPLQPLIGLASLPLRGASVPRLRLHS